jgi:hypothetical protein
MYAGMLNMDMNMKKKTVCWRIIVANSNALAGAFRFWSDSVKVSWLG